MVPWGGTTFPPSNSIQPRVRLSNPPMIDKEVDFPALCQKAAQPAVPWYAELFSYPLDPSKTKIPFFGTSKDRSATAVTGSFFENNSGLKSLPKFWTEMAVSGGIVAPSAGLGFFFPYHARPSGLGGSYNLCSSSTARYGQRNMLI